MVSNVPVNTFERSMNWNLFICCAQVNVMGIKISQKKYALPPAYVRLTTNNINIENSEMMFEFSEWKYSLRNWKQISALSAKKVVRVCVCESVKCGTASVVPTQNSMQHEIDTVVEKTQKKKEIRSICNCMRFRKIRSSFRFVKMLCKSKILRFTLL